MFPAAVAAVFVAFVVGGAVAFAWALDLPARADGEQAESHAEPSPDADYEVLDRYGSCAPPGTPERALRTSRLWTYCRGPFSVRSSFGMYGHDFRPDSIGIVRPPGVFETTPLLVASYRVKRKEMSPPAPVLRLQAFGAYLVADGGRYTARHPKIRPPTRRAAVDASSADDDSDWYRYAFTFPLPRRALDDPITLGIYYDYRGNVLASRVRIAPDRLRMLSAPD